MSAIRQYLKIICTTCCDKKLKICIKTGYKLDITTRKGSIMFLFYAGILLDLVGPVMICHDAKNIDFENSLTKNIGHTGPRARANKPVSSKVSLISCY